jgi:hypothetical protein
MEKGLEWVSDESPLLSTRGDIIRWWEARRYHFNGFVLTVGFASWLLVIIAGSAAVKPGEDFEEPIGILRPRHLCCDGECLLHARMGCGHDLVQRTPTDAALQVGTDSRSGSRRATGSLGCSRMAYHRVHRAKARLNGWRNSAS